MVELGLNSLKEHQREQEGVQQLFMIPFPKMPLTPPTPTSSLATAPVIVFLLPVSSPAITALLVATEIFLIVNTVSKVPEASIS